MRSDRGIQTCYASRKMLIAGMIGSDCPRYPEFGSRFRECKIRWHHSNDFPVSAIQNNRSADDVLIGAKTAYPQIVTQYHHRIGGSDCIGTVVMGLFRFGLGKSST